MEAIAIPDDFAFEARQQARVVEVRVRQHDRLDVARFEGERSLVQAVHLRRSLKQAALETAEAFSMPRSADKALACYESLKSKSTADSRQEERGREEFITAIKTEWDILKSLAGAGDAALGTSLFSKNKE